MTRYFGKYKEDEMGKTNHDIFRDDVRGQFKKHGSSNNVFEHQIKVENIDENAYDYYYNKQISLRRIRKDTQERNDTLRGLLRKREFKKNELKRFKELEGRKLQRIGLTYKEDLEWENLLSIKFAR